MEQYAGIDASLEQSSEVVLMETRQAKAALSAMIALLTARKLRQKKMLDVELGLRGVLRGFGLRIGKISKGGFVGRMQELASGNPMLE